MGAGAPTQFLRPSNGQKDLGPDAFPEMQRKPIQPFCL